MNIRARLAIKLALWVGGQDYRLMLMDTVAGMVESIVTEKTQVVILEGPTIKPTS